MVLIWEIFSETLSICFVSVLYLNFFCQYLLELWLNSFWSYNSDFRRKFEDHKWIGYYFSSLTRTWKNRWSTLQITRPLPHMELKLIFQCESQVERPMARPTQQQISLLFKNWTLTKIRINKQSHEPVSTVTFISQPSSRWKGEEKKKSSE